MPATKRKRSSGRRSYRRSYKRGGGVSTGAVVRAIAKANASMGPFGPGSANFEKYGPSKRQMLANPGLSITAAQKQARMLDRYYGDGDYSSIGHWGSRFGGAALGAMQGFVSGGVPGAVSAIAPGWERGANFSKSMGWGDYSSPRVSNQIVSGSGDTGIVINDTDLSGDVIITNREFVGNVVSSTTGSALVITKYGLNPADTTTFPFLSNIAKNFELYEWQGLGFQYIPTSGEGADQTLGKVIMVTNYDPSVTWTASNATSQLLQNYDYAVSCKPSVGMFHGVETAPDKRPVRQLYIDSAGDPSTRDGIFRTVGNFFIGVEGLTTSTAAKTVGELWVTYRVRLSRMRLAGGTGFSDSMFYASGNCTVTGSETVASKDSPITGFLFGTIVGDNNGLQLQRVVKEYTKPSTGNKHYQVIESTRPYELLNKVEILEGTETGRQQIALHFNRNVLSRRSRILVHVHIRITAPSGLNGTVVTTANVFPIEWIALPQSQLISIPDWKNLDYESLITPGSSGYSNNVHGSRLMMFQVRPTFEDEENSSISPQVNFEADFLGIILNRVTGSPNGVLLTEISVKAYKIEPYGMMFATDEDPGDNEEKTEAEF